MTRDEFKEDLQFRSDAFEDVDDGKLDKYLDSALREYSKYRPQRIISQGNDRSTTTNEYDPPTNYQKILWVKESYTQTPIEFRLLNKLQDDNTTDTKLVLGRIESPSFEELTNIAFYVSPQIHQGSQYITGYDKFDVCFTRNHTIETVDDSEVNTLQLWAEYLEHSSKASREGSYTSLTDREPSGASTETSEGHQANVYLNLAKECRNAFYKEVKLPYGTRDTTPRTYDTGYNTYIYSGNIFNQ